MELCRSRDGLLRNASQFEQEGKAVGKVYFVLEIDGVYGCSVSDDGAGQTGDGVQGSIGFGTKLGQIGRRRAVNLYEIFSIPQYFAVLAGECVRIYESVETGGHFEEQDGGHMLQFDAAAIQVAGQQQLVGGIGKTAAAIRMAGRIRRPGLRRISYINLIRRPFVRRKGRQIDVDDGRFRVDDLCGSKFVDDGCDGST